MEERLLHNIRCIFKYPKSFQEGSRYPLLIYLHGAGSRFDMDQLLDNPFFHIIETHKDLPFVIVAPLCTENTWFDAFAGLKRIVKEVSAMPFVDSERVYAMGASMGGYAIWQLAMSVPETFAAIVPICGGGMYWNAGRLANVPVWAFHGEKDTVVFPEESIKMVEAVNRFGGNARLTLYPENDHDAWSDTYSNAEVFSWLLQHRKSNSQVCKDEYNNAKQFG